MAASRQLDLLELGGARESQCRPGGAGILPCSSVLLKLKLSIRLCCTWAEGLNPFLSRPGVLAWYHQAGLDGPGSIPLILLIGSGSRQGSLDLGACF